MVIQKIRAVLVDWYQQSAHHPYNEFKLVSFYIYIIQ